MDRWVNICMYACMYVCMDRCMLCIYIYVWMNGMDGWMDR